MPPWAAFECERTGWTLERIATDDPSSAAASAARCPARPAPITRTSWVGIPSWSPSRDRAGGSRRGTAILWDGGLGAECAPDLVDGHDSPHHAVGVDRHQRAERREALGSEQRLERLVDPDPVVAGVLDRHHLVHAGPLAQRLRHVLDLLPADEPEEAAGGVDHGEPRPAVAQEELVEGAVELGLRRQYDRLVVHHVGHA